MKICGDMQPFRDYGRSIEQVLNSEGFRGDCETAVSTLVWVVFEGALYDGTRRESIDFSHAALGVQQNHPPTEADSSGHRSQPTPHGQLEITFAPLRLCARLSGSGRGGLAQRRRAAEEGMVRGECRYIVALLGNCLDQHETDNP